MNKEKEPNKIIEPVGNDGSIHNQNKIEEIKKNGNENEILSLSSLNISDTVKEIIKEGTKPERKTERKIEYDDLPLDNVNMSRISDQDNFIKIVDDVLNKKICLYEGGATTLTDISKYIFGMLQNHKGKVLNEQESLYLLNKMIKMFPGKLFKRGISYNLYDFKTKKYSNATTVFGGLLFEERPRKLSKIYKL